MEFLVYFFLFSCLSYGVVHFIVVSTLHLRKESKQLIVTTELLTALDYIGYALQAAPAHGKLWKKKESKSLVWHDTDQNHDTGVCLIKNKIWRITGSYSIFKQAWTRKKKSLLAKNIKELSFDFNEATVQTIPHIQWVTCSLTGQLDSSDLPTLVKKTVALENRAIV